MVITAISYNEPAVKMSLPLVSYGEAAKMRSTSSSPPGGKNRL
jgi:hypothetical protein